MWVLRFPKVFFLTGTLVIVVLKPMNLTTSFVIFISTWTLLAFLVATWLFFLDQRSRIKPTEVWRWRNPAGRWRTSKKQTRNSDCECCWGANYTAWSPTQSVEPKGSVSNADYKALRCIGAVVDTSHNRNQKGNWNN